MGIGRRRGGTKGRDLNGVILLDKPIGLSSNEALQRVKRLFQASKAGHTGSLDVLAEGLLPLCFGNATRLTQFLLDADKHYVVCAQLGIQTSTGDAEGEVIQRQSVKDFTFEELQQTIQQFLGPQTQIPSMYSAIKHQGKPLYHYARQGITIERESRPITIHEITLISVNLPFVMLKVHSSKGTYIRTLVEDIGKALGCSAHVRTLRRTQVAGCQLSNAVKLSTLATQAKDQLMAYLQPCEILFSHWPRVTISASTAFALQQGRAVFVDKSLLPGWIQLLDGQKRLIGIGEVLNEGWIAPRRFLG